ncbi:MAG TPA: MarR family transcriptional regulator [Ktedonobacterales bacterium]|nr:MarR family transcriptional regulator [Ktedonobacterales bacterium]
MPNFSTGAADAGERERRRRAELFAQLQVLGETSSTETALFHQAAAAKYGLGITDMKALGALMQEGPMTAGQIAKRLSLTSGAVTSLIDRLERRDLVKRAPDPNDRRKVIVIPNLETLASGENVYRSMGEAFNQLHETYTTEQLEFLVHYLEASIALNKQEIEKLARKEQILPDDG